MNIHIPPEIWCHILTFLNDLELAMAARTCGLFNAEYKKRPYASVRKHIPKNIRARGKLSHMTAFLYIIKTCQFTEKDVFVPESLLQIVRHKVEEIAQNEYRPKCDNDDLQHLIFDELVYHGGDYFQYRLCTFFYRYGPPLMYSLMSREVEAHCYLTRTCGKCVARVDNDPGFSRGTIIYDEVNRFVRGQGKKENV